MNDWLEKGDVPEDTKATMHAQQLQRVKQLKNQIVRPEPSAVQMITHTEQTMTSESDTSEQLSDAKSCKITDSETEGSFRRHQLERQWTTSFRWVYHTQFQHCRFSE